jgi:uncharacterized protein YecE (DUF72 family)
MSGAMYIGTSGWQYAHWRGRFYPRDLPAKEMLGFYARELGSVAVDSSFYRLPEVATVVGWREATPAGFASR